MKERIFAMIYGWSGSALGMVLGFINVKSIIEAFILGAVGALGGLIVKLIWMYIKRKCRNEA